VKKNANFQLLTSSCLEQREYILNAISLLGNHPFASELKMRLAALMPQIPSTAGFNKISLLNQTFTIGTLELGFSPTGGISHLLEKTRNFLWADSKHPLGQYQYITYSAADYTKWLKDYTPCDPVTQCSWVEKTHGKFNVSEANPQHNTFFPQVISLYERAISEQVHEYLVQMKMENPTSVTMYGGAQQLWSHFVVSVNSSSISIDITLQWFNKTATRLPESHYFTFNPRVSSPDQWKMDKLGELVSPLEVVLNGSHNLHGINPLGAIVYNDGNIIASLKSLDIPIVTPGSPSALPEVSTPPDMSFGFSYLLLANIWGTNWAPWYPFTEEDSASRFRFQVQLHSQG